MLLSSIPQEQDTGDPGGSSRRSSGSSEGQVQGREQENQIQAYSCQAGGNCELKDTVSIAWYYICVCLITLYRRMVGVFMEWYKEFLLF